MRSEVADCVCMALQVWSTQRGCNISALEVAQRYSVSLRALFGKDRTRPNFCSISDGVIIHGGIGIPGSPCLILWGYHIDEVTFLFSVCPTQYTQHDMIKARAFKTPAIALCQMESFTCMNFAVLLIVLCITLYVHMSWTFSKFLNKFGKSCCYVH